MKIKETLLALTATATIGGFTLVAGTAPASARMVCNGDGDCWHSDDNHARYSSDVHAQYYPDDWYFHQHWNADREHHYRDYHEGHGYYRGGIWVGQ